MQKFACPHLTTILHRELVQTLMGPTASYKLVLVCAPVGYGKSTLLADFVQQASFPCCWYTLDQTDRDTIVFLERLLKSIRSRFPHFGLALDFRLERLRTNGQHEQGTIQQFVQEIVTAIEAEIAERFVLVLCNYHEVDPHINTVVNHFLRYLPPQGCVLIESRALPTLDLNLLLAHREVFGLFTQDLRFSSQEVYTLAHELLGMNTLSMQEAEQLTTRFEGWIAGILLGSRLGMRLAGSGHAFPPLHMGRNHLLSYLMSEVFEREPDIYTVLSNTSILAQLTPPLCDALLDTSKTDTLLAYMERQGLFITRTNDTPPLTYVCHPTIRELLIEELRQERPERFATLHRQAAHLFYQTGDKQQAITHALEAGEYDLAAHFIMDIAQSMLLQGYWETLASYLHALPPTTLEGYPRLLLCKAQISLLQYQVNAALPLLNQAAERLHMETQSTDSIRLSAEILIARSQAWWFLEDYSKAQEACRQAIALLPEEDQVLRALAFQQLGVCTCLAGSYLAGITHLQEALKLWGQMEKENRPTALLHGQLANAYNIIGNYALASHHHTRAIDGWERLGDVQGKINSMIGLGATHLHQGTLASAERVLQQALSLARASHIARGEAYALVNLGVLYLDQDRFQEALAITEDGLVLARQLKEKYLVHQALVNLATVHLLLGDPQTALLQASEIKVEPATSGMMSYEAALRELLLGTIYLAQQRYDEAYATLRRIERNAQQTSWKRGHLKAVIRLASCCLARGQRAAAIKRIEHIFDLNKGGEYDHLVQTELRRQPGVAQLFQILSQPTRKEPPIGHPLRPTTLSTPAQRCCVLALGSPLLLIDGVPVKRWRMSKAMELFFFLLDRGIPVHKEHIIDAIWRDSEYDVDQLLRSTIHYLRRAIGEACIIQHAGTYALDLSAHYGDDVYSDVIAFQEYASLAKEDLLCQAEEEAAEAFEHAVKLYRGDYLESLYSDWCIPRRDELRRTYMDALMHLARLAWNSKQLDACLEYWQRLLVIDNCLEEAHYGIMCCYLNQGKRAMALRQYQECCAILQQELKTLPGDLIQKFYQKYLMKMKNSSHRSLQSV